MLQPSNGISIAHDICISDARGCASECPDVKNYKWRLNPVWHRSGCFIAVGLPILQQWASKG